MGLRNFGRTNPIRLGMPGRPPEFGEQTEEVLAEFGFGADEVAQLRQAKVVWREVACGHKKGPGKSEPLFRCSGSAQYFAENPTGRCGHRLRVR
jgi:hypothetical protein